MPVFESTASTKALTGRTFAPLKRYVQCVLLNIVKIYESLGRISLLRSQGRNRSYHLIYPFMMLGFDHKSQNWTSIDGRPPQPLGFYEHWISCSAAKKRNVTFPVRSLRRPTCIVMHSRPKLYYKRDSHDLNNEKTGEYSLKGARKLSDKRLQQDPHLATWKSPSGSRKRRCRRS